MKKIISAILSLSLLAGVAAMPVSAAETYSLGDVDMDGKVDSRDSAAIMVEVVYSWIAPEKCMLTEEQLLLADTCSVGNSYEFLDLADALCVMQYYVYSLVSAEPVSAEVFFEKPDVYRDEADQSEKLDDAIDQAAQEGNGAFGYVVCDSSAS